MGLNYLVTGASGQFGALVIEALLKTETPESIGALVRRPEATAALEAQGVVVRQGDYTDAASLRVAFDGVERLLLISSSEVGARAAQHQTAIDAAVAAGVGFVAYTSILRATESPLTILPEEHVVTERALAASGLRYAVLRNGWYSENYAMGAGTAVDLGALYGAAGAGRVSGAARRDYAEAAAAVLRGDLPESGTVYELAGDEAFTLAEFAAEISALSGKDVPYVALDEAGYKEALLGAGLPEPLAAMLADSDRGAAEGGLYSEDRSLSRLIGRPTTDWRETLRAVLVPDAG
ncbi:SDR family oxidoreductase [Ponticoccus alexandrii]|uniref:NmrA family NAD(P)-binding protein n=1 Tax=Ponticoccus alexandrii TaxID=1943633 RepID=A0ABX7F7J1_9RHOB|nr:SDR family oxidoreductase [Ponticoccus alexandrii]ETA51466.2 quinone oxidoreductase [Rhodobacteraceae bacterium PD-2]QRF66480.1 NmrA family NAD(P)-binding protein [Ponticoccus alexandrii]